MISLDDLDELPRSRRSKILNHKQLVSAKLSETTRNIAFGCLGVSFALIIGSGVSSHGFEKYKIGLAICALFSTASILLDSLQYLFGYINTQKALGSQEQNYPLDWSFHARSISFFAKQGLSYAAGFILFSIIARHIFESLM